MSFASNLPSGVTDAMIDSWYGDCLEGCPSWYSDDCTCEEILADMRDEARIDAYLDSKEI